MRRSFLVLFQWSSARNARERSALDKNEVSMLLFLSHVTLTRVSTHQSNVKCCIHKTKRPLSRNENIWDAVVLWSFDVRHLYQSHWQLSNGASADLLIWSYHGFRGTAHQSYVYEYFIGSWVQVLIFMLDVFVSISMIKITSRRGSLIITNGIPNYSSWLLSYSWATRDPETDEKSHDILIAACGKVQQHRVHPELLF